MSALADKFGLFTVTDVLALFPADVKPTKAQLEKLVRESGCYRNVLGKAVMMESDVAKFFEWIRAAPSEVDARDGAGSLLRGAPPAPNSVGHIVVIAAQTGVFGDDMVFLAWAPVGGVQALVERVQFGCSFDVAVKVFRPGTPAMLATFEAAFENERYRGGWFMPTSKFRKSLNNFMEEKDQPNVESAGTQEGVGGEVEDRQLGEDEQR